MSKGFLRASIEEAALKLKPEQVSAPIETDKDIYLIQLIAAEDDVVFVRILEEIAEVLPHGIGRALIPVDTLLGLLGRHDVDKSATKRVKVIGALHVTVQRGGLKLGEEEYPVDLGIDAIRDRDIHEAILAREGNRGLAAF